MDVTETLAEFTVGFQYEDIPPEVIKKAKRCILDSLGCAIGGYDTWIGKTIISSVKEFTGPPHSTIMGDGSKVAPHQAAFANTALANMLDFDDTSEGIGHPGNTAIPASLAVGEFVKASGRDFLLAVVLAYEVSTRIGYGIKPTPAKGKFIFIAPCWEVFNAAVAASKLLALDKKQTVIAFGTAGDSSPVPTNTPKLVEGPLWNKCDIAFASSNGVQAAFMARKGVPGPLKVLDGDGFWIQAASDTCDFDVMTAGLGKEYRIMAVSFKPYPSCAWLHSANDAVAAIIGGQNLRAEDIREIKVRTGALAARMQNYAPKTAAECEFSLPYGIAMVALRETVGAAWHNEEKMQSKEVIDMLKRIKVEEDPEATNLFNSTKGYIQRATADIITKEGRTFSERIDYKKGQGENPFTDDELKNKFQNLAMPVLKAKKANEVIQMVDRLEEISDISTLAEALKEG